jgi:hypothetical protein
MITSKVLILLVFNGSKVRADLPSVPMVSTVPAVSGHQDNTWSRLG